MQLKSDSRRWGSPAKFFHWTVVFLLLVQAGVGFYMVSLPKRPSVLPWFDFHKSLGLTILLFAVLRLAWRAFDRRPEMPASMPRWQVTGARLGHVLLYALLFAVPLSGWLYDSASSLRPLYLWHWIHIPHLMAADRAFAATAKLVHFGLFWALALVAAGHAGVALLHHFVHRDGVLLGMLPGRRTPASDTLPS